MKTILYTFLYVFALTMISCKKKPSAGLGGNANLKITAFHHTAPIDSGIVYIKFNSSEAPADNTYDLNQPLTKDSNNNSYTIFKGLKKGDYYLYAEGWDPLIAAYVKGGLPYTIGEEGDISLTIPVTEVH